MDLLLDVLGRACAAQAGYGLVSSSRLNGDSEAYQQINLATRSAE
ncbi:hypothetical protein [Nonomuraea sp. GTA35]